jgi:hypothetical protein
MSPNSQTGDCHRGLSAANLVLTRRMQYMSSPLVKMTSKPVV